MLKEGKPTEGDIDWIVREISSNPDEKKKLFELLRVNDDDPGYNSGDSIDNAKDFTDGMTIPRHLQKNQTYEKLAALLGESPLNRRDLAVKTCCIQKGECNTRLAFQFSSLQFDFRENQASILFKNESKFSATSNTTELISNTP